MGDISKVQGEPLGSTPLFTSLLVGNMQLQHRVIMAPLTRNRGHPDHTPSEMAITYYSQRASVPGTLLISEGTFIAEEAGGMACVPGIYNDKQIAAWKKITNAVHAKGSFIFCQLWALGRTADAEDLATHGYDVTGPGDIPVKLGGVPPRPLTAEEIPKWVELYAQAARNAVEADFDGIEIHGANGYLVDQFLQTNTNNRTDKYGGSIENRCRFALEVVAAVSNAIGQQRTAIRMSPWERFQGMRMKDPIPTFSFYVEQLKARFPQLAYIHVPEPVVESAPDVHEASPDSNDFLRKIWSPKVYVTCAGYSYQNAGRAVPRMGDLVAFGRYFIANPDLPLRLREGIPLNHYDRSTFYTHGPDAFKGYTDYPTAEELKGKGL